MTDRELLHLAGKLAISCQSVLCAEPLELSERLKHMSECLRNYNKAIFDEVDSRHSQL